VAGSTDLVRAEKPQQRLRAPEERQAGSDPCQGGEAHGLTVLPAQVRACTHGVYLKSTDNRPDDYCWWCDPENISGTPQTRDHLFKHYQQAKMWARVKEEAKRGRRRWRVGDLLADERCSPAVLDFLRTTYVGRAALPVEENWDRGEEEEERAVAAADVLREEEEEEEPGGGVTHVLLALGPVCVSFCLAENVWRVCGSVSFCPLSFVLTLLSFLCFPLLFCALLLSGRRGDEDGANEPIGAADRKRIK